MPQNSLDHRRLFDQRHEAQPPPGMLVFARIWQAADKVVYSKSLETVSTPKTRIEREFDPQAVRDLKAQLPHDASVAGPSLAAHVIRTGLVDEYHLLVVPTMLGGGTRVVPGNVRIRLDIPDERRFADGMVYFLPSASLMAAVVQVRSPDRASRFC